MAAITRYVNVNSTAGGDGTTSGAIGVNRAYSSQNEMEAAEQTDLVANGDTFECICSGGLDSVPVVFSGWTTSASNTITIASSDFPSDGVFDSSKYYLDKGESAGAVLIISEDFIRIQSVQFQRQSIATSSALRPCIQTTSVGVGDIRINGNIFKSIASNVTGSVSAVSFDDSSPVYEFKNNVVYGFSGLNDFGVGGIGGSASIDVYNNTYINCTNGIASKSTYLCKNNIFQDCANDISGVSNASNDYNLTDNVSIPGVNSVSSSILTFKNKASDDFALLAGDTDAIGAGIGPASDTNVSLVDIIWASRSGVFTDIGAFVFVGGGGITVTADIEINKPVFAVESSVTLPQPVSIASLEILKPEFVASISITSPVFSSAINFTIDKPDFSASISVTDQAIRSNVNFNIAKPVFSVESSVTLPLPVSSVQFTIDKPVFNVFIVASQPVPPIPQKTGKISFGSLGDGINSFGFAGNGNTSSGKL